MMPAARAAAEYDSASDDVVSWALRPLGFGTTKSREPSKRSCCSPIVALGCENAARYAVIPATATTVGAC